MVIFTGHLLKALMAFRDGIVDPLAYGEDGILTSPVSQTMPKFLLVLSISSIHQRCSILANFSLIGGMYPVVSQLQASHVMRYSIVVETSSCILLLLPPNMKASHAK